MNKAEASAMIYFSIRQVQDLFVKKYGSDIEVIFNADTFNEFLEETEIEIHKFFE